ncbi:hypothetical protein DPMD02_68 [Desulfofustis phage LS06-2018-MD02]|jgi:hypothetical protein|nr:hypothetical protein DPMD02_68 [Desulfofustis phage LS06-2018-MD02]
MSKPNPLPILVDRCDLKLGVLRQILPPIYWQHIDSLHRLVRAPALKPKTHRLLFDLTLTAWGQAKDKETQRLLWKCYFDRHLPHIWHVLFYMLEIPMPKLVEKSGLTEKAIRKYLPRSRVPIRHVKAIGSFAIEYRDAMASKKSRDGVDPRYIILHRTLTDRRRMKMYGDLDED